MEATPLDPALQTEYLHLQKTIEDFDGKAMTIKHAVVVVVGAGLFAASLLGGIKL